MLDVAAAYEIVDSRTDERIGSVKRSVASFLKHEHALIGPEGEQVATVAEDSWVNAFLRRNVTTLVPFAYSIDAADGTHLGDISGRFSTRDRTTSVSPATNGSTPDSPS